MRYYGEDLSISIENKGITKSKFAELCGLSPSTITKYCNGSTNPRNSTMKIFRDTLTKLPNKQEQLELFKEEPVQEEIKESSFVEMSKFGFEDLINYIKQNFKEEDAPGLLYIISGTKMLSVKELKDNKKQEEVKENPKMTFAMKLQYYIDKSGYTLKQTCYLADIDISTLRRFLRGERIPAYKTLVKLAKAFNVSVEEFLDGVEEACLKKYGEIKK